jgi:hypothetical protein
MLEATHADVAFLNSGYNNFHFLYVSVTGIVLAYMKYYLHILFSLFLFFLQSSLVKYRKSLAPRLETSYQSTDVGSSFDHSFVTAQQEMQTSSVFEVLKGF